MLDTIVKVLCESGGKFLKRDEASGGWMEVDRVTSIGSQHVRIWRMAFGIVAKCANEAEGTNMN